jgi:hypothetical protein
MPKNIIIEDIEGWDSVKHQFTTIKGGTLRIEHSLLSIANWEAETEKCFLDSKQLTDEELLLYIKCMTINNVPDSLYKYLSIDNYKEIQSYMDRKMTATRLKNKGPNRPSREQNSAEMIYYQMISLNIPKEFEKWHINRLLTLIQLTSRMTNAAYDPKKKNTRMTSAELSARNDLNKARKKQFNTHG